MGCEIEVDCAEPGFEKTAMNTGAIVVDIASVDDVLRADDANLLNCNHPIAKGNEIVAQLFAKALGQ